MSKRGTKTVRLLLSWGPEPVSASGPSLSASRVEINAVKPQKAAAASTATVSSVRRGSLFTSLRDFQPQVCQGSWFLNKHSAVLIMSAFSQQRDSFISSLWAIPEIDACTVCVQNRQAGHWMLTKRGEEKKAGSVASNYMGLIGGSVYGLGQGRTGNTRPGVVARATWCRCTADRLHQGKHPDEIKANID